MASKENVPEPASEAPVEVTPATPVADAVPQTLADAKPIEITNTQAPENDDVMLEKTVLMPRILLEEENKVEAVPAPAPAPAPAQAMEPLPQQAATPVDPNKPQKVTEEEFLVDSSEVQSNPFATNENGVK